jgi:signal transduction histidine kinase
VVADELEQMRGAHPDRRIELVVTGDDRGRWDGARLQQLLRNLVSNAIQYGAPDEPVRVAVHGEEADVRVEVMNSGPTVAPSALVQLFEPLKRGARQRDGRDAGGGLGLGLFIVREIARAHGGEVEVRSGEGETTFAVRLPRRNRDASP